MSHPKISLILPYYDNPNMLRKHLMAIDHYAEENRNRMELLVVDDGSPRWPAIIEGFPKVKIRLWRCLIDVRWNWLFCRNLAAQEAHGDWLLLTDIDHLVPEKTMQYLLNQDFNKDKIYRFSRRNAPDLDEYKPHPNSWFMTAAMYEKIGGYDERFSGFYGTDADFRDRCHFHSKEIHMLRQYIIRYSRDVLPDASTTTYGRKEKQDRNNVPRIREEREQEINWKTRRVTFPYQQVYPVQSEVIYPQGWSQWRSQLPKFKDWVAP